MHYNYKNLLSTSSSWSSELNSPLYLRLYRALKQLIIEGDLKYNSPLPPSRVIAKDLELSRSTVLKAYDLLLIEKYISSKKGSGYFVKYNIIKPDKFIPNSLNYSYPKISRLSQRYLKHRNLSTDNFSKSNIPFRPGLPPLDIFPITKWKNLVNEFWQTAKPSYLSYAPVDGIQSFKNQITNYLKVYRSIDCDPSQVIIVSGSLHSLFLIGNSLLDTNDEIAMENPTFPRAHSLFSSLKANIIPCNVDKDGMQISKLKKHKPKLIYTTPSNQYPLGVKMNMERRKELLEIASNKGSLIIEDDYDHEFSNWDNPLPSVFSLDKENRVIYLGTFNKLMHPSMRLAYMIVPPYLVEPIKSIYEQSSRFISPDRQVAMRDFIKSDYLNIHLRKVLKVAEERRKLFEQLAGKHFDFNKSHLGLHIIGKPKNEVNDNKLFEMLLSKNVIAYPLSNYYITKEKENGLVFGFSSVNKKTMKEKINAINSLF